MLRFGFGVRLVYSETEVVGLDEHTRNNLVEVAYFYIIKGTTCRFHFQNHKYNDTLYSE